MLDFPASPTNGQTFTGPNGIQWVYDGQKWLAGTSANVYAPIDSPPFTGNPTAPTPAAGDADTSIATTAFVTNAVATSLHDVGRNYLHNPLMRIAQRGAGAFNTSGYTLDRWYLGFTNDTASVSQQPLADNYRTSIGDEEAAFALSNTFTGNAAAGANTVIYQPIENVRRLAGKTVTLSFWALCGSGALKLGINYMQSFGSGGSPSGIVWANATGQSVTLNTAFTRYSVTTTIPSAAGKTFGSNGNDATFMFLICSSGATNNTLYGNVGVQSGLIWLWGVQLELGTVATPLEKLDPVTQLQQCQRFFYRGAVNLSGMGAASGGMTYSCSLPVTMRAQPTYVTTPTAQINCTGLVVGADNNAPTTTYYTQAIATAASAFSYGGTFTASADL